MKKRSFVLLQNARYEDQRRVMEGIRKSGNCPFCPEHLKKSHREPILRRTEHWILTRNQWPYENTRVHLIAITRVHAERISELPEGAGEELIALVGWAEKRFRIKGGGFGFRFGSPEHSGGTVRHLHAQIMTARTTNRRSEKYKPLHFRLG